MLCMFRKKRKFTDPLIEIVVTSKVMVELEYTIEIEKRMKM